MLDRVRKVADHSDKIRPRYREFLSNITGVDTEIFQSQIPGGMISNMESQLKQQGAGDKIKEVLEEVPNVRRDAGYPPLVTPSSQIVGTQAVFNVMMGRYKVLTGEFADLMLGYYGATHWSSRSEGDRTGAEAREEIADQRSARRPSEARVGRASLRRLAAAGLQRHRRGCADVRDVPAGSAEVLRLAGQGPKNVSKDPDAQPAAAAPSTAAAPDAGIGPVRTTITYDVKLNGKTHKVTVSPA